MKLNKEVLTRTSTYTNALSGLVVSVVALNALEMPLWMKCLLIGGYVLNALVQVVTFKE